MRTLYKYFFLFLSCAIVFACGGGDGGGGGGDTTQPTTPVPVWSKAYDFPPGAMKCEGQSVKQTSDGGYVIVGTAEIPGRGTDVIMIKTDAEGKIVGAKPMGGLGNDFGRSVQQTSDGGYIILGEFTMGSNRQMWLIKLDSKGNDEWDRFYGYDNYDEYAAEVQQTSDGGYILIGTTLQNPSNVFLVKTDKDGNVIWYKQKGYDDSAEGGTSVRETSDHGFIFTGWTNQFDRLQSDLWLVKVDANGATVWHQHYGYPDNPDSGNSVRQTTDGGYIIVGSTWIPGNEDIFVVKTDSVGNPQWYKNFGGSKMDWGAQVELTNDGGYVIAGVYSHDTGESDGYLIKLDAQGTPLWENIFGGTGYDYFYSVQATADGGYIMTGSTQEQGETHVYLVKTDSKGSSLP
jgi:hypothetical protein